jgi:hypothetical protein
MSPRATAAKSELQKLRAGVACLFCKSFNPIWDWVKSQAPEEKCKSLRLYIGRPRDLKVSGCELCVKHPSRTPHWGGVQHRRGIMFAVRVRHSGERIVWVGDRVWESELSEVRHSEGNDCVGNDDLVSGEVELSDVSGLQTEIRSPDRLIQSKKNFGNIWYLCELRQNK